jgi:hypothetical protein
MLIYMSRLQFTSAACPECKTDFDRLPVEYDEEGGYAVLPVHPCAHETCGKFLCPCCDQFHCDYCGGTFCADHLVSVPDGERPLHLCTECAVGVEPLDLPAPIPPQSETRPTREPAWIA